MGRNYQKIQRGYSRSREKEWTQAIVDEDYYEEQSDTISIGGGDPGVPALMAAAIEREPPQLAAVDQPFEHSAEPETAFPDPDAPTESPYEAMAAIASKSNAVSTPRKLWRRLTRLMKN